MLHFLFTNGERQKPAGRRDRLDPETGQLIPSCFAACAFVQASYRKYVWEAEQQQKFIESGDLLALLVRGLKRLAKPVGVRFLEDIEGRRPARAACAADLQPNVINVPPFERGWDPLNLKPLSCWRLEEIRGEPPRGRRLKNAYLSPDASLLYQTLIKGISLSQIDVS